MQMRNDDQDDGRDANASSGFGPGDDVFNGGRYSMVCSVVVVADCAAGVVAPGRGDGGDGAVVTVTEDDTTIEQLCHGVAGQRRRRCGYRGQHWLATGTRGRCEQVMIWVLMLRR